MFVFLNTRNKKKLSKVYNKKFVCWQNLTFLVKYPKKIKTAFIKKKKKKKSNRTNVKQLLQITIKERKKLGSLILVFITDNM